MTVKRPSLADNMRQVMAEPPPVPAPTAVPTVPSAFPSRRAPEVAGMTRPTGFYAATRAGKKKLTASVDASVHARLKILAVNRATTTEALLSEAVADLLQKLDPAGAK